MGEGILLKRNGGGGDTPRAPAPGAPGHWRAAEK
jgi:hypothetical protein